MQKSMPKHPHPSPLPGEGFFNATVYNLASSPQLSPHRGCFNAKIIAKIPTPHPYASGTQAVPGEGEYWMQAVTCSMTCSGYPELSLVILSEAKDLYGW